MIVGYKKWRSSRLRVRLRVMYSMGGEESDVDEGGG